MLDFIKIYDPFKESILCKNVILISLFFIVKQNYNLCYYKKQIEISHTIILNTGDNLGIW